MIRRIISITVLTLALFSASNALAADRSQGGTVASLDGEVSRFTSGWAGVWELDLTLLDCTTNEVRDAATELDTVCAGDPVSITVAGTEIECTGAVTDLEIDVQCVGSITPFPTCTASVDAAITATRDSDTFNWLQIVQVTGCRMAECVRITAVGTHATNADAVCAMPVAPASWGHIKVLYRR